MSVLQMYSFVFLINQSYVHFGSFQQKTQLSVYQMYINSFIKFLKAAEGWNRYEYMEYCLKVDTFDEQIE